MTKIFNIQKNNHKEKDSQPDYRLSFKIEDTFVEGGACWKKQDKNGNTYISCKLGDSYKDHTDESKSRKGYHIEEDASKKPVDSPFEPQNDDISDF